MGEYSHIFTRIATPLRPWMVNSEAAIIRDKDFSGGYRIVDTIEDRDNIPEYSEQLEAALPESNYRRKGMLVYVTEEEETYRLGSGLTNNDWQEVDMGEMSAKGWIFPPVLSVIDELPSTPSEGDRHLLTTDNKIHEYKDSAWIIDQQTETLKDGLVVVSLESMKLCIFEGISWHYLEIHERQHAMDSPEDHAPDEGAKGQIIIMDEEEGKPTFIDIQGDSGAINVEKNFGEKKIIIAFDETQVDHNELHNWEADRHRKMNYDDTLKSYLIEP